MVDCAEEKWLKRNAQMTVAVCALVVSMCALGISVQQGCEYRRYVRLSVKPLPFFSQGATDLHGPSSITVTNPGLGPAVVDRFRVWLGKTLIWDSAVMDQPDSVALKQFVHEVGEFYKEMDGVRIDRYFNPLIRGVVLNAPDKITLFSWSSPDTAHWHVPNSFFVRELHRFQMRLDYHSVYGEKGAIDTDKPNPLDR